MAFYPLAMLAPFLRIERLGFASESSLLGGIRAMFQEEHYLVGGIVLLFSVLLPAAKLLTLLGLSTSAKWIRAEHRAVTYRAVEQLGRWGMLDVLLVAVLVAFVKLGDLVSFEVGPGLYLFAGFVTLNLLAGMAFNPHLLWEETMDDENQSSDETTASVPTMPTLPVASTRTPGRRLWWLVAIVGVIAAAATAVFLWPEPGHRVVISFQDGRGLRPGDGVRYHGIEIGEIRQLSLDANDGHVDVTIELEKGAESLARQGTAWWIVRPEIGLTGAAGLETLLGSKYVTLQPGDGDAVTRFVGLERPPLADLEDAGGLRIVVQSNAGPRLKVGAGIYHRGVRIGGVDDVGLASDASAIEYDVYIRPQFRRLITRDTKFWNTGGTTLGIGLDGVTLRVDSIEELLAGGMAIAVPEAGAPVPTGSRFELVDEPEDEWREWRPLLNTTSSRAVSLPSVAELTCSWTRAGWIDRWRGTQIARGAAVRMDDEFVCLRRVVEPDDAEDVSWTVDGRPASMSDVPVDAAQPFGARWQCRDIGVPEDVRVTGSKRATSVSAAQWIQDDAGYRLPTRLRIVDGSLVVGADGAIIGVVVEGRIRAIKSQAFVRMKANGDVPDVAAIEP